MKKYHHITEAERKVIEILLQENYSPKSIADKLNKDKSTIYREIRKRSTPKGYFCFVAQSDYESLRTFSRMKTKLCSIPIRNYVVDKIEKGWSPACISGRLKYENSSFNVCAETIYAFIYLDEYCVERKLYQYLRRGKRRRTKLSKRKTKTEKILNKISIEKRPESINTRAEFGHWEGDSIVSKGQKSFMNTLVERFSRFTVATKLLDHTAKSTREAVVDAFEQYYAKSLTVDNGTEFAKHKEYGLDVYFCHAYASWEKGTNENTNGLIRRYLPKTRSFEKLSQEELNEIVEELNNRPRKVLGYQTPKEVYNLTILNCCTSP